MTTNIHLLGIGGSGMSGVACIAKDQGYTVTGCDTQPETAYSIELKKYNIPITFGHNKSHLENIDKLIVTPAVLFKDPLPEEVSLAKDKGILMTWQQFLGKQLQHNKEVICISGTHGKSTTTALAALLFESVNLDPSVMIGANVKQWGTNFRVGKGNLFITESDEFYDNFLNYNPNVIVLNNIENDHPDFFLSEQQLFDSFKEHLLKLRGKKILIVNQDSKGVGKLINNLPKDYFKDVNLVGYTLGNNLFETPITLKGKILEQTPMGTKFIANCPRLETNDEFFAELPGEYNVENILGIIALSRLYKVKIAQIKAAIANFQGIGRRLELIGEKQGTKIYDDYAHHPTAISKTLAALKQKYPDKKIFALVEPHSFSRTRALLNNYKDCFISADKVIVGPIFKARDNQDFGVSGQSIVDISRHKDILYIESPEMIIKHIIANINSSYVLIVMGAGESYKWATKIMEALNA